MYGNRLHRAEYMEIQNVGVILLFRKDILFPLICGMMIAGILICAALILRMLRRPPMYAEASLVQGAISHARV